MEAFPFRFRLHSSKRALASSSVMIAVLLRGMPFLLAGCSAAERPYQLCGAEFMQPCRKLTIATESSRKAHVAHFRRHTCRYGPVKSAISEVIAGGEDWVRRV